MIRYVEHVTTTLSIWAILVLPLTACSLGADTLTIYPIAHQQVDATAIDDIIGSESAVTITEAVADPELTPLDALRAGAADITITENSHPFVPGVRSVLPLYRSVMHILIREELAEADFEEAEATMGAEQATIDIMVVNQSHAAMTFLSLSAQRSKWFHGNYRLTSEFQRGDTDIIIYVGPINPGNTRWYREGYRLVSLGDLDESRTEFFSEGISYLVPQLEPARIPALTYNLPGNELGLETLAVDTLLVARADAPERAVYELTQTLIEQKARFAAIAPNIFSWLSEDFDPLALNFPLHRGARAYLERDEPGFLERYAESLNFIVYLSFLVLTGVVALARWQARRKKNRVDTFYAKVLEIRERAARESKEELLEELEALEKEAFGLLISERLAADESFRIFTELLGQVRSELR